MPETFGSPGQAEKKEGGGGGERERRKYHKKIRRMVGRVSHRFSRRGTLSSERMHKLRARDEAAKRIVLIVDHRDPATPHTFARTEHVLFIIKIMILFDLVVCQM